MNRGSKSKAIFKTYECVYIEIYLYLLSPFKPKHMDNVIEYLLYVTVFVEDKKS